MHAPIVHARLPINLLASPGKHNVSMTYLYRNVVCATTTLVAGIYSSLRTPGLTHGQGLTVLLIIQLQLLTTLYLPSYKRPKPDRPDRLPATALTMVDVLTVEPLKFINFFCSMYFDYKRCPYFTETTLNFTLQG